VTRRALRIVDDAHFVLSRDNKRFLALEPGNPDLGAAPGPANDTDLPIRIRRGDLRHIAAPLHETDARVLGYADPLHLAMRTRYTSRSTLCGTGRPSTHSPMTASPWSSGVKATPWWTMALWGNIPRLPALCKCLRGVVVPAMAFTGWLSAQP